MCRRTRSGSSRSWVRSAGCAGPSSSSTRSSPSGRSSRRRSRSEEHTSELQSQSNLVCRLLLEKKKKNQEPLPACEDLAYRMDFSYDCLFGALDGSTQCNEYRVSGCTHGDVQLLWYRDHRYSE